MMDSFPKFFSMKFQLSIKHLIVSSSDMILLILTPIYFLDIYGAQSNHPSLAFIVVKKRHNTRFFTYHPDKKPPKTTDNMSIGCVVDTTIVHPYQHNFYLNSHNAYQGVNNPPLYHVLLDKIGFTKNELQLLTYHLCFTDPRSSASEAIPSVVHQADLAAWNARDLFCSDDEE